MTPAEVLRKAADKIEGGHWTQKAVARDVDGTAVWAQATEAVCWCATGAIRAVIQADDDLGRIARNVLRSFLKDTIINFNDEPGRTEAEVVTALRAAATEAERAR